MIAQVKGTVSYKGGDSLIVETGGVGFLVYTLASFLSRTKKGSECVLWTHLAVRESGMELYGFETREELSFFELLTRVSGIGPRSALAILNIASIEQLTRAISAEDTTYLTKVSGIGKKTAAKIVFELKDKLGVLPKEYDSASLKGDADVIEALQALGYSHYEALRALQKIGDKNLGTNEKIKEALRQLG